MSKKTKEKVKLFEKAVLSDAGAARELYEKEDKQFKFRLICTGIALVSTIVSIIGLTVWSSMPDIIAVISLVLGVAAAILSGPVNVVKLFLKTGKLFYYIMPIFILDIAMFGIGLVFALMIFVFAPVVFTAFNLYQSYINRKDAEAFLALNNNLKETTTYEEN